MVQKRVKIAMDFEAKISVKREKRGIKIYGCSYEEKGKKKKLEKSKDGSGVKEEEVHTNWGKGEWCERVGKVLIK